MITGSVLIFPISFLTEKCSLTQFKGKNATVKMDIIEIIHVRTLFYESGSNQTIFLFLELDHILLCSHAKILS